MVSAVASAIFTADVAREAEVADFHVVLVVDKDVFALEVSVCDLLRVHIADTVDKLAAVVSYNWLGQAILVRQVKEELTLAAQLAGNVADPRLCAITLLDDCLLVGCLHF